MINNNSKKSLFELEYGFGEIESRNTVMNLINEKNLDGIVNYSEKSGRFIISTFSDLSVDILKKILYPQNAVTKYIGCYPKISKKERDNNGNLFIQFTSKRPKSLILNSFDHIPYFSNTWSGQAALAAKYDLRIPDSLHEILRKIENALSTSLIHTMCNIIPHDKTKLKGIWYADDYKHFLNKHGEKMPNDYWGCFVNEDYFDKVKSGEFILKQGKSPSDAIIKVLEGPSVLPCGLAVEIAQYKAILDVLGKHRFDVVFSDRTHPMKISAGIVDVTSIISVFTGYERILNGKSGSIGQRPIEVGDLCGFTGYSNYTLKHPMGFANAWNVIYIGNNDKNEQLFMGHGFEKPLTEKQINKLLIESYNRNRTSDDEEYINNSPNPASYCLSSANVPEILPIDDADSLVGGFQLMACVYLDPAKVLRMLSADTISIIWLDN